MLKTKNSFRPTQLDECCMDRYKTKYKTEMLFAWIEENTERKEIFQYSIFVIYAYFILHFIATFVISALLYRWNFAMFYWRWFEDTNWFWGKEKRGATIGKEEAGFLAFRLNCSSNCSSLVRRSLYCVVTYSETTKHCSNLLISRGNFHHENWFFD